MFEKTKEIIYDNSVAYKQTQKRYCYRCGRELNGTPDVFRLEFDNPPTKVALFHKECVLIIDLDYDYLIKIRTKIEI